MWRQRRVRQVSTPHAATPTPRTVRDCDDAPLAAVGAAPPQDDTGENTRHLGPRQAASLWSRQALRWGRASWVDIVWVVFVAANLVAMRFLPGWQTVPFLVIWVSLTAIYGFRLWRLQPTILTGPRSRSPPAASSAYQVLQGEQDADYLAEVPLIALMFLVMVWHGRRRLSATEERLAALEEVQRVSQQNLRLLAQQRQFLQDASHELGTPLTVALGHAELIEQAAADQASPRTREWRLTSCSGCAGSPPECCCWHRPGARISAPGARPGRTCGRGDGPWRHVPRRWPWAR